MRNVRFWALSARSGWVRLTLKPGQSAASHYVSRDWEGSAANEVRWHYDAEGGVVTRESDTVGSDCDGRYAYSDSDECPVAELAAHRVEDGSEVFFVPKWRAVSAEQRDYAAEAAGY